MAIYSYRGLNAQGKEIKNSITCDSEAVAKQKIRSIGIMLIEIKEQKTDVLKEKRTLNFGNTITIADLSLMTRQMATLIKARIQIVEALEALVDQSDNPQLKVVLSEVKQKVNEGSSLAQAMGDYPNVFNNIYINMVDAGETSGTLDIVLLRLAEFTESQVRLQNKIKGALIYPTIMVVVGSIMMSIIFIFVIPKITRIFISMKKELPLQTKICIWISGFLKGYWWAVLIGGFLSYYLFKKYIRTKSGERKWHSALLKIPVIGKLTMMINVSRFCSTLATLLNSGVPILSALKIVRNLVSNVHMQGAVGEARDSISEGKSLAGPLQKSGYFPAMVTHMISLGEKSGELEPMLQIVAENYEEEVNVKLSGLSSIIEPIMITCMGLVVGFIVFSVVVPMMDLNTLK